MERSLIPEQPRAPKPQETPEQKAARLEAKTLAYFERFFEEAFEEFIRNPEYELPREYRIIQSFSDEISSPIQEEVESRTLAKSCLKAFFIFCQKLKTSHPEHLSTFTEIVERDWIKSTAPLLHPGDPSFFATFALLKQDPLIHANLRNTLLHKWIEYFVYSSDIDSRNFTEQAFPNNAKGTESLIALQVLPDIYEGVLHTAWDPERAEIITSILSAIGSSNQSILLRYAAQEALHRIDTRDTSSTTGHSIVPFIVQPNEPTSVPIIPVRISRDMGGFFDEENALKEAFFVDEIKTRDASPETVIALNHLTQEEQRPPSEKAAITLWRHILTLRTFSKNVPTPRDIQPLLFVTEKLLSIKQRGIKSVGATREYQEYIQLQRGLHASYQQDRSLQKIVQSYLKILLQEVQKEIQLPTAHSRSLNDTIPGVNEVNNDQTILLQAVHQAETFSTLEKRFGFPLVELSLREQLRLAEWLIHTNEAQGAKTIDIIRTYGVHAAQTFLACEQGAKHGEQILAFAQTAPKEVASRVFAKFADIANLVDTSAQDLASQFLRSPNKDTSIDVESVRRELIKRGARILTEAHTLIQQDPSGDSLLARLERYKADTVLFLSLCTTTLKQHHGQLQLEQLRDIKVSTQSMHELSVDDRRDMAELLEQQWSKKPLEHLFPETGSYSFFLLRRHGRVIGFLRFEQLSPDAYHANFLCVDESLRGSGLGEQLFTEVMDRAAKTGPVHAEFDPVIPAGSMYIERFGFIGTGTLREDRPDGIAEWITLERNNALSGRLTSRDISITPERLQEWALSGHAPKPLRVILLTGDTSTMEAQMLRAIHSAKQQNSAYLLSRYLRKALPSGQEERLLVFDIPQEQVRKRSKYASSVPQSLAQAYTP